MLHCPPGRETLLHCPQRERERERHCSMDPREREGQCSIAPRPRQRDCSIHCPQQTETERDCSIHCPSPSFNLSQTQTVRHLRGPGLPRLLDEKKLHPMWCSATLPNTDLPMMRQFWASGHTRQQQVGSGRK